MMTDKLRKRILATKGVEFIFLFGETNGEDLDGLCSPAYVAQADPDIGITIMGVLPEGIDPEEYGAKDGIDIVIQCCNCCGDPEDPEYIEVVEQFLDLIESRGMKPMSCDVYGGSHGSANYMMNSCPFNNQ